MTSLPSIGLEVPEILLPGPDTDLTQWAVVACDQYTSEPEYWAEVAREVGDAPSSLHLIFPEVFLADPDPDARIARIRRSMYDYLNRGLFREFRGFVLVHRQTTTGTRRGLVVALDLEAYSFEKGAQSLIRATEGTILERLPPRIKIREGAPLELPHIMVLIDDPADTVIGPLSHRADSLPLLYDFELMKKSGRIRGHAVSQEHLPSVTSALTGLLDSSSRGGSRAPFLYAMGDGNHSLATAKRIWDGVRASAPKTDPRRYALVEIVNVHDRALEFEPIHRVLFDVQPDWLPRLESFIGPVNAVEVPDVGTMEREVRRSTPTHQRMGVIDAHRTQVLELTRPTSNLPVGTLQPGLDSLMKAKVAKELDYVHGTASLETLSRRPGNAGLFLPPMDKADLFETVVLDGALPRKTFSMGEADDKRFYLEARRLIP